VPERGGELMRASSLVGALARVPLHGVLVMLCAAWLASASLAAEEYETLPDPEQQARYAALIQEVRCLTCLNRSIADSETPLANDLRREIRELIASGKTDAEVVEFLTARYGDFVMYRPPLNPRTWALWAGPFAFLLIGAAVFGRIVYRRMRQPIEDDAELDDALDEGLDDGADDEGVARG